MLVYRVFRPDKADGINVGNIIPIPQERDFFDGNQSKIDTENLFEQLRKESYSNLPSRKSVLFVLPYDKTIVEKWVAARNTHNDCSYFLCTLRVTGSIIWCDEEKFTEAGIPNSQSDKLAKEYWEGASDVYEHFDIPEGLFNGEAIVEELVQQLYESPYKY